jgi:hypothetical protein
MILRTLLLASALAIGRQGLAAMIELTPDITDETSIDLAVLVDGQSRCSLKREVVEAHAASRVQSNCRFELPETARSLVVRGEYKIARNAVRKGEQTVALVDFAPVSAHLLQTGKPYGERMADFITATNAFAQRHKGGSDIAPGKPVDAAAIDAARTRLGYALPADWVSLQKRVGAIGIGDHHMTPVGELTDSYTFMRRNWGTPEAAMQAEYSPRMQEFLKTSTLLFTEVGDGLGGLLFRPPPTKACGDRGTYYWTSQEGGSVDLSKDGACADFAEAFRWVLEGFLISDLADKLQDEEGALLIDSSTGLQHVRLRLESSGNFKLGFERRGQSPQ